MLSPHVAWPLRKDAMLSLQPEEMKGLHVHEGVVQGVSRGCLGGAKGRVAGGVQGRKQHRRGTNVPVLLQAAG